jgi:hypothetical protein
MATSTTIDRAASRFGATSSPAQHRTLVVSDSTVVANNIQLDADSAPRLDITDFAHCYASLVFFDGDGAQVQPTAGTYVITVQQETSNFFESPASNSLDLSSDIQTINWRGPTTGVLVTASDAADGNSVSTYELRITAYKS